MAVKEHANTVDVRVNKLLEALDQREEMSTRLGRVGNVGIYREVRYLVGTVGTEEAFSEALKHLGDARPDDTTSGLREELSELKELKFPSVLEAHMKKVLSTIGRIRHGDSAHKLTQDLDKIEEYLRKIGHNEGMMFDAIFVARRIQNTELVQDLRALMDLRLALRDPPVRTQE
jgi:hypothetical protein